MLAKIQGVFGGPLESSPGPLQTWTLGVERGLKPPLHSQTQVLGGSGNPPQADSQETRGLMQLSTSRAGSTVGLGAPGAPLSASIN